jgi:hypothetical protein
MLSISYYKHSTEEEWKLAKVMIDVFWMIQKHRPHPQTHTHTYTLIIIMRARVCVCVRVRV